MKIQLDHQEIVDLVCRALLQQGKLESHQAHPVEARATVVAGECHFQMWVTVLPADKPKEG